MKHRPSQARPRDRLIGVGKSLIPLGVAFEVTESVLPLVISILRKQSEWGGFMLTRFLLIIVGVLIVAQTPVFAYTDPGSGTLILQMLLAAAFGVMFYLRRIIGWFRGLKLNKGKAAVVEAASAKPENGIGID